MQNPSCPSCESPKTIKSGIIKDRQRYRCKACEYHFTVQKKGKQIDNYYVVKALQLYMEGVSYREIERILGVSHVSVMNWVKKYKLKAPAQFNYRPTYKILNYSELAEHFANRKNLQGNGMIITEIGDKFMMIKWERFKD